jgi:ligand-binding SRPBCC domain-containing protein
MEIYSLRRRTMVAADLDKVWAFLSNPHNLNMLTPPELRFTIVSDPSDRMYDGMLVEYQISIPLFGRWRWLTEIKHIHEKCMFVDEQRVGPYKLWYHSHHISETENGTLIIDEVRYVMPFSLLGRLVHYFHVSATLKRIFDFRESKLLELLGKPTK